jgi:acetyl esterase/lipase
MDIQNLTVQEETIDDALAAVQLLRNTPTINPDQIFLLGHSLGGMLAPRIGQQDHNITGLLLLAAPTRPIEDLMLDQTIYLAELDGNITEAEQTAINQTQDAVNHIKSLNITPGEVILGASLKYWEDLATYDSVATAKNLTQPLLILQGERDYQVTMANDYLTWRQTFAANPNVTLHTYDTLNHLFISGTGPPNNEEYNIPGNVAEQVITDITNWIQQYT